MRKRYVKKYNLVCQYFYFNNKNELRDLYFKKLKSYKTRLLVQDLVTISLEFRDEIYDLNEKIIECIDNNNDDGIYELLSF